VAEPIAEKLVIITLDGRPSRRPAEAPGRSRRTRSTEWRTRSGI